MTLSELRYLSALAEERHFGRAAQRCHITQPTLSAAIKKLEQSLGVILVERHPKGARLTDIGWQIALRAQRAMTAVTRMRDMAHQERDELAGVINLGVIPTLGPYLLPQLMSYLTIYAPKLIVRVCEAPMTALCAQLEDGELDAIVVSDRPQASDIVIKLLFEEPLSVVTMHAHPLAQHAVIGIEQLAQFPLLLLDASDCFSRHVSALCPWVDRAAKGAPQASLMRANSLETLRAMASAGLGVAVLPQSAATPDMCQHQDLVARPLALAVNPHHMAVRRVSLAWRLSFPRYKTIDALHEAIQTCSGAYWGFAGEKS